MLSLYQGGDYMAINKEKKTAITVVLDNKLYGELKKLAENDQRSISKYVSILIQNHIDKR